jgi:hypothetical protein
MNAGGYPPGVFEHTRGAPWNDYQTEKCNGCGRLYYPAERPRGILPDDMSYPPDTEYGREFSLCINCERERDICSECLETALTPDGREPRAVDGCADCKTDPPCIRCGAPVSVCECNKCETCGGSGEIEISIGGDGFDGRCCGTADVPTICGICDGTGIE